MFKKTWQAGVSMTKEYLIDYRLVKYVDTGHGVNGGEEKAQKLSEKN